MNPNLVQGAKQHYYPAFGQFQPGALGDLLGDLLGDVGYAIEDVIKAIDAYPSTKDSAVKLYNFASKAINEAQASTASSESGVLATVRQVFGANSGELAATDQQHAQDALLAASSKAFADPVGGMAQLRAAAKQCFIAYNAAAERDQTLAKARSQLFTDLINGANQIGAAVAGVGIGVGALLAGLGVAWFLFRRK